MWSKGKIKDIYPIHPTTVFEIDDKDVVQFTGTEISRKKCVLFAFLDEGRSPYGISLLRSVYKPWYIKSLIENHDLVMTDRALRGLPVVSAPEGVNFAAADPSYPGYDPATQQTILMMTNIVSNIYDGKQKGAVLPNGWELNLVGHDPHVDINEKLKHYRTEICIALLDSFVSSTTAREGNTSNVFIDSINYFGKKYVDVLNEQVSPMVKKIEGKDVKFKAFLKRNYDLNSLASYLTRLGKNEMIVVNDEIKEKLTELAGLM